MFGPRTGLCIVSPLVLRDYTVATSVTCPLSRCLKHHGVQIYSYMPALSHVARATSDVAHPLKACFPVRKMMARTEPEPGHRRSPWGAVAWTLCWLPRGPAILIYFRGLLTVPHPRCVLCVAGGRLPREAVRLPRLAAHC